MTKKSRDRRVSNRMIARIAWDKIDEIGKSIKSVSIQEALDLVFNDLVLYNQTGFISHDSKGNIKYRNI